MSDDERVTLEFPSDDGGDPIRVTVPADVADRVEHVRFEQDPAELAEELRGAGTLLIPRSMSALVDAMQPSGDAPAIEIVEDDDPRLP